MYRLSNDKGHLTLEDKPHRRTPSKPMRRAECEQKDEDNSECARIDGLFRTATLEDEMTNLDMIKERLK